jgi:hypothetical protein
MTATLPQIPAVYDSRPSTWEHIHEVQRGLNVVIVDLLARAHAHDQSKLVTPEVEAFDVATPLLAHLDYTTQAYRDSLESIRPALEHHYSVYRHHPQHFEHGIRDMNLMDLIEMLVDWKAACLRHDDGGNIRKSIEFNAERFGYGDELKQLLHNTVDAWENQ